MDRDLRREYEKSRERNLTDYWLSIGQEFTYSINRLSKLIGNAHELSTGRYKERLLIDLISKFIIIYPLIALFPLITHIFNIPFLLFVFISQFETVILYLV